MVVGHCGTPGPGEDGQLPQQQGRNGDGDRERDASQAVTKPKNASGQSAFFPRD